MYTWFYAKKSSVFKLIKWYILQNLISKKDCNKVPALINFDKTLIELKELKRRSKRMYQQQEKSIPRVLRFFVQKICISPLLKWRVYDYDILSKKSNFLARLVKFSRSVHLIKHCLLPSISCFILWCLIGRFLSW